jgi:hypothetical protein
MSCGRPLSMSGVTTPLLVHGASYQLSFNPRASRRLQQINGRGIKRARDEHDKDAHGEHKYTTTFDAPSISSSSSISRQQAIDRTLSSSHLPEITATLDGYSPFQWRGTEIEQFRSPIIFPYFMSLLLSSLLTCHEDDEFRDYCNRARVLQYQHDIDHRMTLIASQAHEFVFNASFSSPPSPWTLPPFDRIDHAIAQRQLTACPSPYRAYRGINGKLLLLAPASSLVDAKSFPSPSLFSTPNSNSDDHDDDGAAPPSNYYSYVVIWEKDDSGNGYSRVDIICPNPVHPLLGLIQRSTTPLHVTPVKSTQPSVPANSGAVTDARIVVPSSSSSSSTAPVAVFNIKRERFSNSDSVDSPIINSASVGIITSHAPPPHVSLASPLSFPVSPPVLLPSETIAAATAHMDAVTTAALETNRQLPNISSISLSSSPSPSLSTTAATNKKSSSTLLDNDRKQSSDNNKRSKSGRVSGNGNDSGRIKKETRSEIGTGVDAGSHDTQQAHNTPELVQQSVVAISSTSKESKPINEGKEMATSIFVASTTASSPKVAVMMDKETKKSQQMEVEAVAVASSAERQRLEHEAIEQQKKQHEQRQQKRDQQRLIDEQKAATAIIIEKEKAPQLREAKHEVDETTNVSKLIADKVATTSLPASKGASTADERLSQSEGKKKKAASSIGSTKEADSKQKQHEQQELETVERVVSDAAKRILAEANAQVIKRSKVGATLTPPDHTIATTTATTTTIAVATTPIISSSSSSSSSSLSFSPKEHKSNDSIIGNDDDEAFLFSLDNNVASQLLTLPALSQAPDQPPPPPPSPPAVAVLSSSSSTLPAISTPPIPPSTTIVAAATTPSPSVVASSTSNRRNNRLNESLLPSNESAKPLSSRAGKASSVASPEVLGGRQHSNASVVNVTSAQRKSATTTKASTPTTIPLGVSDAKIAKSSSGPPQDVPATSSTTPSTISTSVSRTTSGLKRRRTTNSNKMSPSDSLSQPTNTNITNTDPTSTTSATTEVFPVAAQSSLVCISFLFASRFYYERAIVDGFIGCY